MLTAMKFHGVKLPSIAHYSRHWHYVLPAAVLTTCLVVLAAMSLPGGVPLMPLAVTSTAGHGRGVNGSCDIFKGEWVPDPGAPGYTNETCPVIHGHYDCMRYGKPDLGFVRWRWRPDGCELPRFDAARFLGAMRGKSVAFVGDSLARNQMHSLVCLLARAERPVPWTKAGYVYRYERHGFAVAVPRPRRRDRPGRPDAQRGGPVEPPPGRAGRWMGGPRRHVRLHRRLRRQLVLPAVRVLRAWPPRRVQRLPRAQRHRPHAPVLPAAGVPERAPRGRWRAGRPLKDGHRADDLAVALRERHAERGRRLRPDAASPARRVGDGRGAEGDAPDTGRGVRGGRGCGERERGEDAAHGRDGGHGAAAGRPPEQVPAVGVGEVYGVP
ncbi:hypothetical protein VPH35_136517 [Triticum aestivum]